MLKVALWAPTLFCVVGCTATGLTGAETAQCDFNPLNDFICTKEAEQPTAQSLNPFGPSAPAPPSVMGSPLALAAPGRERQLALTQCFSEAVANSVGLFGIGKCNAARACMTDKGFDPDFACGPDQGLPPPGPACDATSGAGGQQALMSDSAADTPGINTHVNYAHSVYDTRYDEVIRPRLIELGVRHIRDNPGGGVFMDRFVELSRSGIKILMINWNQGHQQYVKQLNARAGALIVEAVEPPNESDIDRLMADPGDIAAYMREMYPAYKSDPATRDIVVLGPSFARTDSSAIALAVLFPDAANYMDAGNIHDYPGGTYPEGPGGGGAGISMPEALSRYRRLSGAKPVWSSETGYKMSGSTAGHLAVSQRAAAKYMPREFLMHLKLGSPHVYVYQLINNNYEDFGLLNNDGSPRLQFTAMKNFISMFDDQGAAFTPGTLDYTLSGITANVQQMLFQKRDGKFYLAVWQGISSSNSTADIEPPRRHLTLNLGMNIIKAVVYEPTFSLEPLQTHGGAGGIPGVSLSVPDHLVVVELTPAQCDPGPTR